MSDKIHMRLEDVTTDMAVKGLKSWIELGESKSDKKSKSNKESKSDKIHMRLEDVTNDRAVKGLKSWRELGESK